MKLLLSFFIFLISFFAPAQAINAAIPVQIGSYSNPIEPIKPKAKSSKQKKNAINSPRLSEEYDEINVFIILGLVFLAGVIVFGNGFLQGLMLLFWLGLGIEFLSLVGVFIAYLIIKSTLDWDEEAFSFIIFIFLPLVLFIKGLALLILGLVAAVPLAWILGIVLSLLAIGLFITLVATANFTLEI